MPDSPLLAIVCVLAVVLSGCAGLGGSGDTGTDGINSGLPEGCVSDFHSGDPTIPLCKFTEQPPDVEYRNEDTETHQLQLYVLDDNSTVVLSETLTVEPDSTGVIEDVFDRPGPYTILASTNDTTAATTWDEGQRYYGTGGAVWNVVILPSGQLKNSRVEMA